MRSVGAVVTVAALAVGRVQGLCKDQISSVTCRAHIGEDSYPCNWCRTLFQFREVEGDIPDSRESDYLYACAPNGECTETTIGSVTDFYWSSDPQNPSSPYLKNSVGDPLPGQDPTSTFAPNEATCLDCVLAGYEWCQTTWLNAGVEVSGSPTFHCSTEALCEDWQKEVLLLTKTVKTYSSAVECAAVPTPEPDAAVRAAAGGVGVVAAAALLLAV